MKTILSWLAFLLSVIVCIAGIYILASTIDAWNDVNQFGNAMSYSGANALLIAAIAVAMIGSVLLCVGAFRRNKTLVVMGAILLVVGIVLVFVARAINIAHLRR